ncbi:hypothetical protein [Nonomuraea sp. NPDC048826]|uniref:hypothetical protein n=1 Tax=Nonomuraea sp. NPDC048826 TaxID=3364347 RepID=UPI00371AE9E5
MKHCSNHPAEADEVTDPDFVALGLGGTNMMAMLWTVAMGRRAIGVEMRGDPFLGVHWNLRVDLFHQLGLIDRMMLDQYGEAGVPHHKDGTVFRLAERFYSTNTASGDVTPDEVIDRYDRDLHLVGTIEHVEFIDDRWRDGRPHRVVTVLDPPPVPCAPEPEAIRTDLRDVLDGPSTFQAEAASILRLLRRYLEAIAEMDLAAGLTPPRVKLFTQHRLVEGEGDGFVRQPDGRYRIRIMELQEFDFKGRFVRMPMPGREAIDLGVPELFVIAEGFDCADAAKLGFEQRDVSVDHQDGRGPVVAQADFVAGLLEILIDGRLRRRISSQFDADGREYWVRQIAVGHENDPEVGWILVQVPDFKSFDPIAEGLVPTGTDLQSAEYYGAYQHMLYEFYIEQAAEVLGIDQSALRRVQMAYGPKLFSLIERMGEDALVASNGVVAGDSFGNGHFLTSGGAMTGMIGHSSRILRYWQARNLGITPEAAIRDLADSIRQDTNAWLEVSASEYSNAVPINFGAERIEAIVAASGYPTGVHDTRIEAARRHRHALLPLDASDWRRPIFRNGMVMTDPLPELSTHL